MSLADELKDPWGLLLAGVSGGMAWAVGAAAVGSAIALPVGVAVGAAVLGVKVVGGVLLDRDRPSREAPPELMRPGRGTTAEHWLDRAERAVRAMDELAAGPLDGAASEAHDTLDALRRLGSQSVSVARALAHVDDAGLDAEASRLAEAARRGGPPGVQAELARSAAAVADRIAVRDRLREVQDTVLARMQAGALGLESVVARLAEVVVLAESTGGSHDTSGQVHELAAEVEALRAGLVEAEALSRRVLDPGLDGPAQGRA